MGSFIFFWKFPVITFHHIKKLFKQSHCRHATTVSIRNAEKQFTKAHASVHGCKAKADTQSSISQSRQKTLLNKHLEKFEGKRAERSQSAAKTNRQRQSANIRQFRPIHKICRQKADNKTAEHIRNKSGQRKTQDPKHDNANQITQNSPDSASDEYCKSLYHRFSFTYTKN